MNERAKETQTNEKCVVFAAHYGNPQVYNSNLQLYSLDPSLWVWRPTKPDYDPLAAESPLYWHELLGEPATELDRTVTSPWIVRVKGASGKTLVIDMRDQTVTLSTGRSNKAEAAAKPDLNLKEPAYRIAPFRGAENWELNKLGPEKDAVEPIRPTTVRQLYNELTLIVEKRMRGLAALLDTIDAASDKDTKTAMEMVTKDAVSTLRRRFL